MKNTDVQTGVFQTGRVTLVAFSHFIHDLYTSFLSPLLPLIIEKMSLTLGQAGLLSTVMQVPALMNPVIGLFADNRGLARWLVILAPSLTAVPMCLILSTSSYPVLLALLFLSGFSVALYHVPSPVLISRYSGPSRGRGMSLYMTGGEAARTVGPMAAVTAVSLLGPGRFYLIIVFALLTSVLLYFSLEKESSGGKIRKKGSLLSSFNQVRHVLVPLSGVLAARSFMHAAMAVFLAVYVERQTGSLWMGGAALALYEAFGVAGVLTAGSLSDRLGRRRVLFIVSAVAPVCVFAFAFTSGLLQGLMLMAAGFTILSTTPVMLAIIQDQAGDNPSAANGHFMMISFAVRSLAVYLSGLIGDAAGLANMFVISSVLGAMGLFFLFRLPRDN